MPKGKVTKGTVRYGYSLNMTAERIEFIRNFRESYNVTWADIMMWGLKALMKEKEDMLAHVYLNAHLVAYQSKSLKMVTKKRSNGIYKTVYIYWISKLSSNKYHIHFKYDPSDEKLESWKLTEYYLHKSVRDNFAIEYLNVIPE